MHIKLVQAGPSTETMHGPCAGLKRIWNSKVVTLEICSTPKWNSSSKGGELKRKQITYLNDTMHLWWPVQHNQSVIYFKKAVLTVTEEAAAAVGVWNFFFFWRMRYLRSRDNEKQETAWRKDNTVVSHAPLSLSNLNRLAAMSISSQGKSQSYDLFSSNYMTYPSPPPPKGFFTVYSNVPWKSWGTEKQYLSEMCWDKYLSSQRSNNEF